MGRMRLTRLRMDSQATMGVLWYEHEFLAYTLELPWKQNERRVSCIPWGRYKALHHFSPKFGETLLIDGVANRSNILFHAGNTVADSLGCILLGQAVVWPENRLAHSRPAMLNFRRLITALDIKSIELQIVEGSL